MMGGVTSEDALPAVPRWGLGDVVGALLTAEVAGLVVYAVLRGLGVIGSGLSPSTLALSFLVTSAVLVGWTIAASKTKGTGSLRDDFGWAWQPSDIWTGALATIASIIVLIVVTALLGESVGDPTFGELELEGAGAIIVVGFAVVIGAPLVEELFFRGLFLRSVQRRWGNVAAVVVTSAVFALLHVPQRASLGFVAAALPLFAIGLVLGAIAVRVGRLGPSIVAHMALNAFGFLALLGADRLESA